MSLLTPTSIVYRKVNQSILLHFDSIDKLQNTLTHRTQIHKFSINFKYQFVKK